jgi:hypothetical protein
MKKPPLGAWGTFEMTAWQVWEFVTSGSGLVQAILIAIATALLARFFQPKGKLIWSTSHQHYYSMRNLDGGHFPVRTQQLWVQNVGKAAIEGVEIILNYPPQHLEVWSPRAYDQQVLEDRRLVLTFPYLASNEFFTVSMLDTISDIPVVLSTRSKSGLGKQIEMGPQRLYPRWIGLLLVLFACFGIGSLVWFVVQLLFV